MRTRRRRRKTRKRRRRRRKRKRTVVASVPAGKVVAVNCQAATAATFCHYAHLGHAAVNSHHMLLEFHGFCWLLDGEMNIFDVEFYQGFRNCFQCCYCLPSPQIYAPVFCAIVPAYRRRE
ncbi:hypothetical protein Leryth_019711 [Lithospermum erythrorhizon]|nr:hypothetical protein Leryth_019711 [Lithospermum erythrorhizon]